MKNLYKTLLVFFLSVLIAFAYAPGASAQKKPKKVKTSSAKSSAPAEIILAYKIPEGKSLSYTGKTNMFAAMDFSGQTINTSTAVILSCTATGRGMEKDDLKLDIRIDTMSQVTETPQGSAGGIISEVMGKSFTMLLTQQGKEADITAAEKITFSMEGIQSNVAQSFLDYFPDLPKKPVKPGDTWPTDDTLYSKSPTTDLKVIAHSENTFAGYEKIDGIECAKITSVVSGTREVFAQTMGMDILQSMKFTGTSELYFAVKEGYYLKQAGNSKFTGTVEIGGAQNITMPMTGDFVTLSRLKK